MLALAVGCVSERPADDPGIDPGTDEPSAIDTDWLAAAYVSALAADDHHVYFVSEGTRLARKSLAGGADATLFELAPSDGTLAMIVAVHLGPTDIVFVTDEYALDGSSTTRRLMTLPKAGGTAKQLGSSQDVRAYLGATVDSTHVYFSTFTSLLRVPLAGGTVQFVGESPNSVRYWAFSPSLVDGALYWAESTHLYRVAPSSIDQEGTLVASLPGVAKIIETSPRFVVTLAPTHDFLLPAEHFAEVDPATGAVSPPVAFGTAIDEAVVGGDSVWAISHDGVVRVPRSGGAPVQVTTTASLAISATTGAIFVGTDAGITRIALD